MNRDEMLLETIIDKGSLPEDFTPQSRFESIAKSIINKEDYEEKPQSRQEELFLEIGEMIKQGGGDTPTGTIDITENGKYNVGKYAEANVQVPEPSGIIDLTVNHEAYNVKEYEFAYVDVPEPSGTINITENGFYNVKNYSDVDVNVPRPVLTDASQFFANNNGRIYDINYYLPFINGATNMEKLFFNSYILASVDLSNINTSNVRNMREMFSECASLRSLNLNSFNTSLVEDMTGMFESCRMLESVDLSSFRTKVHSMSDMFSGCDQLTTLDLSSFSFFDVIIMSRMFYGCIMLTNLIIGNGRSSFTRRPSTDKLFYNCNSLESVTINVNGLLELTSEDALYGVKADCKFYVPERFLNNYKTAQYWSSRADYIFPIT